MFNVPFRLVFSLLDCLCLASCCRCRYLSLVNAAAAAGAVVSTKADGKLSASPSRVSGLDESECAWRGRGNRVPWTKAAGA